MVGVAVNVTDVPEHIVLPGFAVILTKGVRTGFTVMVMPLLVAGLPVAHGVALEVSVTFTTSLLLKAVLEKVAILVPAFTPLTCH